MNEMESIKIMVLERKINLDIELFNNYRIRAELIQSSPSLEGFSKPNKTGCL